MLGILEEQQQSPWSLSKVISTPLNLETHRLFLYEFVLHFLFPFQHQKCFYLTEWSLLLLFISLRKEVKYIEIKSKS